MIETLLDRAFQCMLGSNGALTANAAMQMSLGHCFLPADCYRASNSNQLDLWIS